MKTEVLKKIKSFFSLKNGVLCVIIGIILQAGALCCLESFYYNVTDITFLKYLYNLLFWCLLAGLFSFIFGSLRWGNFSALLISAVLGCVEYFVMTSRNSPILPWDLLSLGTAMSVADNYKFEFSKRIYIILGIYAVLIALSLFLGYKIKRKKLLVRTVGALLCAAMIFGFTELSQVESFQEKIDYYPYLFTPKAIYKRNGFAFSFTSLLKYVNVSAPDGYSAKQMDADAEKYRGYSKDDETDSTKYPNVIVIMDEAFSDLGVFGEFGVNEDYMPYIRTLKENTVKGYAYSSVLGGNTANSEFEFLGGDSMAFLPSGSIPYQQYLKEDYQNYVNSMRDMGYYTMAMHPYNSTGWMRSTVYKYFGFHNMYFRGSFGEDDVREYVSDMQCFEKLVSLFERYPGKKPFFTFCVTMQNHGSYGGSTDFENFDQRIHADVPYNANIVDSYLSLIKYTDEAVEYLIEYFKECDEPTVICFFGDHLPSEAVINPVMRACGRDPYEEMDAETFSLQYKVPFFIWANYDIEERDDVETSFNYLNILLSETAGIPLTPYQKYLKTVSEKYPVMTANFVKCADGDAVHTDYFSEHKNDELIKEYESYQYNHIFDKQTKLTSFFKNDPIEQDIGTEGKKK